MWWRRCWSWSPELIQSRNQIKIKSKAADRSVRATQLRIVDVGTGSGAIALALAKELPTAEIHATDISPEALEVARANAARHELTSRIEFHLADLLSGLPPASFDFVVSNPPYVGESEEDSVQLEVRKFEPRNAVFAGPTGLEVIERLIPQAQRALGPAGGWCSRSAGRLPIGCGVCCRVGTRLRSGTICRGSRGWRSREKQRVAKTFATSQTAPSSRVPARRIVELAELPNLERHPHAELRGERNSNRGARAEEISQTARGNFELLQAGDRHRCGAVGIVQIMGDVVPDLSTGVGQTRKWSGT